MLRAYCPNIYSVPKGQFTSKLIDKMHIVAQDLMYFRNVDGSFGDPLTQQTFGYVINSLICMNWFKGGFAILIISQNTSNSLNIRELLLDQANFQQTYKKMFQ